MGRGRPDGRAGRGGEGSISEVKHILHPGLEETLHLVGVDSHIDHARRVGGDIVGVVMEIQYIIINVGLAGICELGGEDTGTRQARLGHIELTGKRRDYDRHYGIASRLGENIVKPEHTAFGKIIGERMDCGRGVRSAQIGRGGDLIGHFHLIEFHHACHH